LKYFSRYGKYCAKNAEILQNLAFLAHFYPKIAISQIILQKQQKATWDEMQKINHLYKDISAFTHI